MLHQFQLAMLTGERDLDTSHDDLAIVIHMDGQGTPGVKQDTWNAVTAAAPRGVFFGWKDFLVKDHPMLTPGRDDDEDAGPGDDLLPVRRAAAIPVSNPRPRPA